MTATTAVAPLDVSAIRNDFPILERTLADGKKLIYLDSANTSHKPQVVIDAMSGHLSTHNSNVARAVHQLGAEATEAFEQARTTIGRFVGANRSEEIIFTKNASEALNLAARVLGEKSDFQVTAGDEVVITEMEHHSNIVPWQQLCDRQDATLKWFGVSEDGRLDLADDIITAKTKVVAVTWVSNALGTINPVAEIVRRAKAVGALVVIDASQAVPQMPVDFAELGADLIAFTGHKLCGPTGIGVLWGNYDLLAHLPPFLGGGEMIEHVTMSGSTYAPPPHRFEAGTPPIAEAIGLGAACTYLSDIGMDRVHAHELDITAHTLAVLANVDGVKIMGPTSTEQRGGAVSFALEGVHPHDISQFLDADGIAVRAGHHCAKPIHQRFGVQSSIRVSPYLYTTHTEIDAMGVSLKRVRDFFLS